MISGLCASASSNAPAAGVANIVMATGRMIDAVTPAARGLALEADQLRGEARQIEQLGTAGVEEGQQAP